MNAKLVTYVSVMVAATTVAASAQSASPSFDCSKASGQVEELICGDDQLAALDRELAATYKKALKSWPAEILAEEKAFQRGWIKGRNDCWKAEDQRACVENSYRTRIAEIQIQSGQLVAPVPVGYTCQGEEDTPFTVTFYRETRPPSAVITFANDQVIAFRAPSASGAKYVAPNVEFWEHHGEAKVEWFGKRLGCKAVGAAGTARGRAEANGFDQSLELHGIAFHVACANDSSLPTLRIVPTGLEIDNSPITREVDGTVVGAEVADLNLDQSPEIYVYVQSAGSGSYGSLVAYSANNRKSLSEVYLPPIGDNPQASKGYMGHDEFAVVEGTLVQRFPVYREVDTNANPTGGKRQLQYKLTRGEASWVLRIDKIIDD
jgi:uncharacterized protein